MTEVRTLLLRVVAIGAVVGVSAASAGNRGNGDDAANQPFHWESLSRGHALNPRSPAPAVSLMNAVVTKTVEMIQDAGWNTSKTIQKVDTTIPLQVNSPSETTKVAFKLFGSRFLNMGSLTRSGNTTLSNNNTQLTSRLVIKNACFISSYKFEFTGVGVAPSDTTPGVALVCGNVFADVKINVTNEVPQDLLSYNATVAGPKLTSVSNMNTNMKNVYKVILTKAGAQRMKEIMEGNVKVKLKQAIEFLKTEASG